MLEYDELSVKNGEMNNDCVFSRANETKGCYIEL